MLEDDGRLRTWRLPEDPAGPGPSPAVPLPDHRLAYLDYEGPVSGGRGEVRRWDEGTWTRLEESPTLLRVELAGTRLAGQVLLARHADASPEGGVGWSYSFCDALKTRATPLVP